MKPENTTSKTRVPMDWQSQTAIASGSQNGESSASTNKLTNSLTT